MTWSYTVLATKGDGSVSRLNRSPMNSRRALDFFGMVVVNFLCSLLLQTSSLSPTFKMMAPPLSVVHCVLVQIQLAILCFWSWNKMLSYRRETALQGALLLTKVEDWNWEIIFCGHYRSSFKHCDIIDPKIYRIRWKKTQNKGCYTAFSHWRSSRSVPIESPYVTSY